MRNVVFGFLAGCLLGLPATASGTLTERAASASAPFERGSFLALGALEGMLQGQYRHGIGRGFGMITRIRNRSLVNRAPAPREADTFRGIIETFLADLDAARAVLGETDPSRAEPFELDLASVFFDVNENGQADPGEAATEIIGAMIRRRGQQPDPETQPLVVRFDGADHAWLTAYTHALSATAETVLAFDPTPVFADLMKMQAALADLPEIENTFDQADLTAKLAESWQAVLGDVEAVLDGRLLLAHPLVGQGVGINLRTWLDNPSALDPIGWIHGHDALPYLARGPLFGRENWLEFQRLSGGRGFAFGFYLN